MENKDEELVRRAIAFEKKHGTTDFIKVAISSLNMILIEKGIATKEEMKKFFILALDEFEKPKE